MMVDTRSVFVLDGADVRRLIWHMALYGLASILEGEGIAGIRAQWSRAVQARPTIAGSGLDAATVGNAVQVHAGRHAAGTSWMQRNIVLKGVPRGLMSPRLTSIGDDTNAWSELQNARHEVLDSLLGKGDLLALRFIGGLGQPAYWSRNRKGNLLQDDGASRLEMQPRNQGSEIVRNRLRPLAEAVAGRTPQAIVAGLCGESRNDEVGNNSPASRTATGLAGLGPTDNAVAWCALWGMSCFPVAPRVGGTAVTSGHLQSKQGEWFFVPVWHRPWTVSRLRAVIASRALPVAGAARLGDDDLVNGSDPIAFEAWLRDRGVDGLVAFPVRNFSSGGGNASDRRTLRGEPLSLAWDVLT